MSGNLLGSIAKWFAYRDAPSVYALKAAIHPESPETVSLRFQYRLTKGGGNIAVAPAYTDLLHVTQFLEGQHSVTDVRRGWSVVVPSAPAESSFDAILEWRNTKQPLVYPLDFPLVVRDSRSPIEILRISLEREQGSQAVYGLTDESSSAGWLAATIVSERDEAFATSIAPTLRCFFAGPGWSVVPKERERISRLVEEAFSQISGQFEPSARGSLNIRRGDSQEALRARSATSLVLDESRVDSPAEGYRWRVLLSWQLSGIWWGGLIRFRGLESEQLLFALRLSSTWRAYSLRGNEGDGSGKNLLLSEIALLHGQLQNAADIAWYTRAIELAERLERWMVSKPAASVELRSAVSGLVGREVDSDWFAARLRDAGLELR